MNYWIYWLLDRSRLWRILSLNSCANCGKIYRQYLPKKFLEEIAGVEAHPDPRILCLKCSCWEEE